MQETNYLAIMWTDSVARVAINNIVQTDRKKTNLNKLYTDKICAACEFYFYKKTCRSINIKREI